MLSKEEKAKIHAEERERERARISERTGHGRSLILVIAALVGGYYLLTQLFPMG